MREGIAWACGLHSPKKNGLQNVSCQETDTWSFMTFLPRTLRENFTWNPHTFVLTEMPLHTLMEEILHQLIGN